MNFRKLTRLKELFESKDIDAVVIRSEKNLEYFLEVEFETPTALLVIYRDLTYRLYISKLDYDRVLDSVENLDRDSVYRLSTNPEDVNEINYREVYKHSLRDCKRVGFDNSLGISERLKNLDIEIVDLYNDILKIRSIKDEYEIEIIKKAIKISEKCLENVLNIVKPGVREVEISSQLCKIAIEHDSWFAFKPIVASGPNSAYPHHVTGLRKIENQDVVIIDFGVRYRCYCSDITRTIFVGNPPKDFRDTYLAVLEAHNEGVRNAKDGVRASEVDKAVRNVLREYGLDKYFIHSTGHGIGIECHEPPSISSISEDVLKSGNIITIEPGVYIKSRYGIRIEDDYLIRENSCIRLTRIPQLLI